MKHNIVIASFSCLLTLTAIAQHTVRISISTLPTHHPSGSVVYVAGSFNGWNPRDEKFRLTKTADGLYSLDMNLEKGKHEFKLTRGSWETAECKAGGSNMENRTIDISSSQQIDLSVEGWADHFPKASKLHTASPQVCVLDTSFYIPQLNRTRRIWLYLPKSYCDGKNRRYPVLYLQDGQNVFDEATSFSGEWGIDEFLDSTRLQECIVVAIDNGEAKRLNEYNPYDHAEFGKGEGALYAKFLARTLKPFIDKHYRTMRDKAHTYIAGSSMGGLISFYTALKYPKIFGGAGVFSPSFHLTGESLLADIRKYGKKVNGSFYFYAGKLEGEHLIPAVLKAYEEMSKVSAARMMTVVRDEGRHTEAAWQKEFPHFYQWITEGAGQRR